MHTVLTALLDCDAAIEKTAASLLSQLSDEVQWVIKNSTLRTTDILQRIDRHPNVTVIYKQDESLYDGLNQGLEYCGGEYLQVVGAGDELCPNAISFIVAAERSTKNVDALFFGVRQKKNGRSILPNPIELKTRMACPHPGAVLRINHIKTIGAFDNSYRIASDYDLMCRYIKTYTKCVYSGHIVVDYEGGGLSERQAVEAFLEEELIRFRVWNQNQVDSVKTAHRFFSWAKTSLGV